MKYKKTVAISEIQEPEWNYNKHPQEQIEHLKHSLTEYSQLKDVVVWQGKVIAGNGLVEAARQLGWEKINVFDASELLTEKQAKGFLVADNRTALLSLPDEQALKDLLSGFDSPLDIPGVTADFLDRIFPEEIDIDDFFEEKDGTEKEKEPKTVTCPDCGKIIEV